MSIYYDRLIDIVEIAKNSGDRSVSIDAAHDLAAELRRYRTACEGINPEAVPKMVELLRAVDLANDMGQIGLPERFAADIKAALALATDREGGEDGE